MLRFLLLPVLLASLGSGESPLDPVQARWSVAVAKAAQAWSVATDKADAQVVREAERAAVSATRRNDVAAAAAAWTEVLRIDRNHEKELVLYGNGKPAGRAPWLGKAGATSSAVPLAVGRYVRNYQGDLASIMFWRRALTAGEVAGLAADTVPPMR